MSLDYCAIFIYTQYMNILSLFDGMSCGQIALERAGFRIENYFASEIDKWAIQITRKNYPNTIQLGDIVSWQDWHLPKIDLLLGGSPCQGFSLAGKRLNWDDPRSMLFFKYVDCLRWYKPTWFLFENVARMNKDVIKSISYELGVEPIKINSALVSAQNRERLYWTNIPNVTQPEDKGIILQDILEGGHADRLKRYCVDACYFKGGDPKSYFEKGRRQLVFSYEKQKGFTRKLDKSHPLQASDYKSGSKLNRNQDQNAVVFNRPFRVGSDESIAGHDFLRRVYSPYGKSPTLTSVTGGNQHRKIAVDEYYYRKLTPVECERLQTLPDNYTELGKIDYFLYNCMEITKSGGLSWNVKLMDVTGKPLPTNTENFVYCTTNDLNVMGVQNYQIENTKKIKDVNIVIEKGLPGECAIDITKIGYDTMIHNIQTRKEIRQGQEVIIKELMVKQNTELSWKISWEENWSEEKSFIILILIRWIIQSKIYTYVKIEANIHCSIGSLNLLQENLLKIKLLSLKMENTIKISNTQRYKMLGNGWTVDVIVHILRNIENG